jgi:hypothetical protein
MPRGGSSDVDAKRFKAQRADVKGDRGQSAQSSGQDRKCQQPLLFIGQALHDPGNEAKKQAFNPNPIFQLWRDLAATVLAIQV